MLTTGIQAGSPSEPVKEVVEKPMDVDVVDDAIPGPSHVAEVFDFIEDIKKEKESKLPQAERGSFPNFRYKPSLLLDVLEDIQSGDRRDRVDDLLDGVAECRHPYSIVEDEDLAYSKIKDRFRDLIGGGAGRLGEGGGATIASSSTSTLATESTARSSTDPGPSSDTPADAPKPEEPPEVLDSYGLPPLSEKDLQTITRARQLNEECGLFSDLREFLPPAPKPKTIVYFMDSFIKEQAFIGKEQRLLVKWQKKIARRYAIDAAKVAQNKYRSVKQQAKRDEAMARKGAAFIASLVSNYWSKHRALLDVYEQKLLEDAKAKRLESQLLTVIDRSSTLTQMMIPGLLPEAEEDEPEKKNKIVKQLLNQPEDMDDFLASLPAEYLASIGITSPIKPSSSSTLAEEFDSDESEAETETEHTESRPSSSRSNADPPTSPESSISAGRRRSTRIRSGPFAVSNESTSTNGDSKTLKPQSSRDSAVSPSPERSPSQSADKKPSESKIEVNGNGNGVSERKLSLRKRTHSSPEAAPIPSKLAKLEEAVTQTVSTNGCNETEMTDDSGRASSPRSIPETLVATSSSTTTVIKDEKPPEAPVAMRDEEMNDLARKADSFMPTGNTYDTAKVRTAVPTLLDAKLREYQHIGLDWLSSLFENSLNGILADEMGLGKTVQTIAFLAHLAENKNIWGPHLIVVPTSVLLNWEREFKRFCPSLKVLTYFGSMKERSEKRKGWKKPNSFNVCITSYDLYIRDTRMFKWRAWQCLVLDEAHNIKNSKSLRWNKLLSLRTRIRLLLTGTPLQNNLMELWSLLYFLMPSVFASEDDFKNWFNDPMNAMIDGSAEYNVKIVDKLHTVLRPFILRRLKSEVEKQMPLKLERVIHCPLARIQRNMYNEFIRQKSTIDSIRGGSAVSVMNIIMQLRKCCNHPNLFYPIGCSAPTALPGLRLSYPGTIQEVESAPIEPSFAMLKSGLIDETENLVSLPPKSRFLTTSINCHYVCKTAPQPLQIVHRKVFTRLRIIHESVPEVVSPKMQWLWRVTKPIRDELENPHFMVQGHIYEPLALKVRILQRKLVRMFSFPTSPVLAPFPTSTTVAPITPIEELACDRMLESEDELVSHVHYATPIQYPDPKLVELDCGKLRMLAKLLRELNAGGHRCLIFTQMSRMLDILEVFLSHHKYAYFRLDGSTPIQQRQILMDRFNTDPRIFAFILSTRSGGVGMNLTGADTVVFYDSDWNPTMDAQAQDRCHRIGQTRNVLIYRLISSHTIEENILKKAMHKRRLGEMTLDEGEFTPKAATENMRELFQGEEALEDVLVDAKLDVGGSDLEKAMFRAEDQDDVKAAEELRKELGEEKKQTTDGFLEELLNELNPVERYSFLLYRDEHIAEIEERLRAVEVIPASEADSADENALDSDDDEDTVAAESGQSTPLPPPKPPKILKVLPKRGSAVVSDRKKRVRFN